MLFFYKKFTGVGYLMTTKISHDREYNILYKWYYNHTVSVNKNDITGKTIILFHKKF